MKKKIRRMFRLTIVLTVINIIIVGTLKITNFALICLCEAYDSKIYNMITSYDDVIIHEVKSGDTIWSITKSNISSSQDIRYIVEYTKRVNSMKDSTIYPGEILIIPVYE